MYPAGVEYYLARDPVINVNNESDLAARDGASPMPAVTRSGYAVDDKAVVDRMSKSGDGLWLPKNAGGKPVLVPSDTFGYLDERVREQLGAVAEHIKSGDISVYAGSDGAPCKYCRFRDVCRREIN